ncbi:MAG: hypothetical protein PUP91_05380 [Rhizonema sp. PD37]|nr:hypothetical protein [Rhizonema sp. PD37]
MDRFYRMVALTTALFTLKVHIREKSAIASHQNNIAFFPVDNDLTLLV